MKRWIVFIFYFILLTAPLPAQQLLFKTYTAEDGLVSNPVRSVFQDKRGFIWIATVEGLSKYDGFKFTNFTIANGLSHNMVNDFYESADGKLYLAENNGTTDILQRDAILQKAVFQGVNINQFYVDADKRIIAITDTAGLHQIIKGKLVQPFHQFSRTTFNDICRLNDSLLIAGSEGPLIIMNNRFEYVSEISFSHDVLTLKLYKDSKNRVWVGTAQGLKILSPPDKSNRNYHLGVLPVHFDMPELRNHYVSDILEDSNGSFWVGTTLGLFKIDKEGRFRMFSEKDGLPSSNISCIYQDREDNIWLGTSLGLVKWVSRNGIAIYSTKDDPRLPNFRILKPLNDSTLILSTEAGIQLFDTKTRRFTQVHTPPELYNYELVKNTNPILFYGNNNLFGRYDPLKKEIVDHYPALMPDAEVYCSIMVTQGVILSGTQKGLLIRTEKECWYDPNLPYRITYLMLDKQGDFWAGTWNNGLYRIHCEVAAKNQEGSDKSRIQVSITDLSSLVPDKSTRSIFEDSQGNIWIGTRYQGLVQLVYHQNNYRPAQSFNLNDGLTSNWVRTINEDADKNIWVGTNLGIDKLIPSGNTYRVYNYSKINNYFASINDIFPDPDHSFWFGTANGLVNIIGDMEKSSPLPIYITSIHLGDTSFHFNDYDEGKIVRLKHFQNQAAFEFSAPGYINEKQLFYSYRLVGVTDTTWSDPANIHAVSYASLQPGAYRFEVRTRGWNEEWGQPAHFKFSIQPPYWKTWWFYALIGLFILLLLYALYLYRIRQLLQLQNVRNRIATDLHDDIGSTLTNISILTELSDKNLYEPLQAKKYLQRITEEVNSSSQALDDIIWSVNSNNDTLNEMLVRMRRFAAELFDPTATRCYLEMQPDVAGQKLSMDQRRDIYLVYKESLNNIYKHAAAQTVWVMLSMIGQSVKLIIRDDGQGFHPEATTHRNGLNNIKSRVEKWKGKLIITSRPGNGAEIEIVMPVTS